MPLLVDVPVFLVGGGPSLQGFDFFRLKGLGYVVGINQAMFDAPVDAGFTIDHRFASAHHNRLSEFAKRATLYLALEEGWRETPGLFVIDDAIYVSSKACHRGPTSGMTALSYFMNFASMIVLLGYDHKTERAGRHRYHDTYPWPFVADDRSLPVWAGQYAEIARKCEVAGIEVINGSMDSAIPFFRKVPVNVAVGLARGRNAARTRS